jgi:hypothetical protein
MKKAVKQYGKAILVTLAFAALILFTTRERVISSDGEITISDSSIRTDILNSYAFEIKEIHGVRVDDHAADSVSYYFEYEADYQTILNAIAALPVKIDDNRTSIQCGLMNSAVNPLKFSIKQSEQELSVSEFFWQAKPEEYVFYECFKGSMKHTLLVSKSSSRILHWIEIA